MASADRYASRRLASLGSYAFAEVDREVGKLRERGIEPIDFGVGDPTVPTPEVVRRATAEGIETRRSAGYPSYIGADEFREAVSAWSERRFGVQLDPATEVSSTAGAKEAVFNFHEAVVDPGDLVLCPTPGYPPYSRGTLFAEGEPYHLPLPAERDFLLDLGAVPSEVARRAKVLWINYPNSPSGAVAPRSFLQEVLEFAASHDLIVASDEAYSEIYFGEPPLSMLNVSKKRVLAFNSLSKRSAMTCYRVGWVAGDPDLVDLFRQVKTNLDSGTSTFIQDGAVAALNDEAHVQAFREEYRHKRDLLCAALVEAGLPDCTPAATLYVWQRVPEHLSAVEFATALLHPEIGIVTTPGSWIAETNPDQPNPGADYVRFALVPSVADTERAAELLRKARF